MAEVPSDLGRKVQKFEGSGVETPCSGLPNP